MNVFDAAAAKEPVLATPLRPVGSRAHHRHRAEALQLSVRVSVGADAPVEVAAAGGQACFLQEKRTRREEKEGWAGVGGCWCVEVCS